MFHSGSGAIGALNAPVANNFFRVNKKKYYLSSFKNNKVDPDRKR